MPWRGGCAVPATVTLPRRQRGHVTFEESVDRDQPRFRLLLADTSCTPRSVAGVACLRQESNEWRGQDDDRSIGAGASSCPTSSALTQQGSGRSSPDGKRPESRNNANRKSS